MNCPRCGLPVPGLACEPCTNLRAYEIIRKAQHYYIADAKAGRVRFFAVKRGMHGRWHLMLFGDRQHTFCGEQFLRPTYQNRTHLAWHYLEERAQEVCDKCLWNLQKLEQAPAVKEKA